MLLRRNKDVAVGLFVALLWAVFGLASQRVSISGFTDRLGPTYFPSLLAICGLGASTLLVLQGARHADPAVSRQDDAPGGPAPNVPRALAMLLIPFVWPLVVPYTGFLFATPAVVVLVLLLLNVREPRRLVLVAGGLTLILWFTFGVLFGVAFPGPRLPG